MGKLKNSYILFALIIFFYYFANGIFNSMLSLFLAGEGKDGMSVSMIVSAAGIFTMCFQPYAGAMLDTAKNKKLLVVLFLMLSAVCAVMFASIHSTIVLFLLNGFAMMFFNSINPVVERVASDSPYHYSRLRFWGTIGYAFSAKTAGVFMQYLNSKANFFFFAATLAIIGSAIYLVDTKSLQTVESAQKPEEMRANTVQLTKGGIFHSLLGNWYYLLFVLIVFLFSGTTNTNNVYLPLLLNTYFQNASRVSTILFLATLVELPVTFLAGKYTKKWNVDMLLKINFVMIILQYLCYALFKSHIIVCCAAVLLKASSTMLIIVLSLQAVSVLVDESCATTALAIITAAKTFGGTIFTWLAGFVAASKPVYTVYYMLLGAAALGFVLTFFLKVSKTTAVQF